MGNVYCACGECGSKTGALVASLREGVVNSGHLLVWSSFFKIVALYDDI